MALLFSAYGLMLVLPTVFPVKNIAGDSAKHIIWAEKTRVKIAPFSVEGRYADYARMVQLKNGSLFCVYGEDGNIMAAQSTDTGKTWLKPVTIAEKNKG